ncbi:hypothetical protein HYH03_007929 [Edaphochlamys debaryana]|uniref:4a-hydroxytetrahydrobiopterin dehydratase n=1 Tax=Edaphochlamys debaryana TaxID=47281 RepID=A0A835Y2I1_9CHLO|nr:hypothetical protein HYH03_007929 [Edaphochlamys debaryana]|eukprot:KAG2494002.1 hypothetical protein HYH03_007929 [Edaphochlamys debaryana]
MKASCLQRQATRQARPFAAQPPRRCRLTVLNGQAGGDIRGSKMEKGLFGDNFGARDPFAGELETGFGEKVLGNYNTEHIIKPPDGIRKVLGLSSRCCQDNAGNLKALVGEELELMRNQVPGWRLGTTKDGKPCIAQSWKLKDEAAAETMLGWLRSLATQEDHADALSADRVGTEVVAQLSSPAHGGVTENDFICASKMNDLDVAPLLAKRKPRYWA